MLDKSKLYELYIHKVYGETPYLDPYDLEANELEDRSFNLEWSNTEGSKLPVVKEVLYANNVINIHENAAEGRIEHYFISKNKPFTFAEFTLVPYNNGIQFKNVWNHSTLGKGLARWAVFNYYLVKYPFVISDRTHTNAGKNYWEKLISEALSKKYKVFVIYNKQEQQIYSTEEAEEYYFYSKPGNYRFKISK
jgi:hypothetical protein